MDLSPKKHRRGIGHVQQIKKIVNREFKNELNLRDKQLELIQQRINQAQKTLHVLRYAIVTNYYNNADKNVIPVRLTEASSANTSTSSIDIPPQRLHPAVRKLLTGFTTDNELYTGGKFQRRRCKQGTPKENDASSTNTTSVTENDYSAQQFLHNTNELSRQIKQEVLLETLPKEKESVSSVTTVNNFSELTENYKSPRNRSKKEYVVVVGNISKWMPAESEEDNSTHKWMVYVRGPKANPSISHFVKNVVFYLHPSYKPNDVVEVKEPPFHLSRRGWGEFPLRVRIHFVHTLNKPVDIVHQLKLDKTFTGRQTLGNETVVNLQLYTNGNPVKSETVVKEEPNSDSNYLEHDYCNLEIKNETQEYNNIVSLDHSYCSRDSVPPVRIKIEQPENDLIYGLNYDKTGCPEAVIEETVLDSTEVLKVSPKLVVKNIIPPNKKRKLDEPLIRQLFQKKQRLYDANIESSKFQVAIDKRRYKNVLQALPFLFKHLPMITKLAHNNIYKTTYPYVAATLEEYKSWNIGRRLSSEWYQAKTILNIIKTNEIPDCINWNNKKLIMYGRAHGYTPLANYAIFKRHPPDYQYDYIPNGEMVRELKPIVAVDEVVDIVNVSKVSGKPEKYTKVTRLIDLNLQKASSYIRHAVLDVGVILKPEEIMPGVLFNAAERVLLQAVLCLSEDLIRKARAKLVLRGNFKEDSTIISIEHICEVLSSRSDFNFLLQSDGG